MIDFIKKNIEAIAGVIIIVLAFGIGRFTSPTKIETRTVTVEIEHKQQDNKTNITKVEIIKPDGTRTITTNTNSETKTHTDTFVDTKKEKIVENKQSSSTNINLLAGVDIHNPKLVYGIAISKGVLGPITIGLWGMSNFTAGASVGLQF